MKKLRLLTIGFAALSVLLLSGCEVVDGETGDYKEGTYFGYSEDGYTAVVYVAESGMIESVFIDAAYGVTEEEIIIEATTKQILGDDYNMKTYGGSEYEWYEQANMFADKVVEEQGVDFVELMYKDDEGNFTTEAPEEDSAMKYSDAITGVTVKVEPMLTAVSNALKQAQ